VKSVDVSIDGGKTWKPATLTGRNEPLAWRSWTADVAAPKGHLSVLARATDGGGAVQPLAAKPNVGGYGNNSCYAVTADVP
jgi:sulfite dehydrogenase